MDERKEQIKKQFGSHADNYVQSADHAQGLSLSRLVELVRPQPDWIVLDVSTGGGHTAMTLAPLVSRVIATDLTPEMLSAAERYILSRGANNVTFQIADAESLGFQAGEFDLVTNRIALHHFGDARRAISEMARVTKPGGLVALIDNVVPPEKMVAGYVNAFEKLHDATHHWTYPLVRLQAMLEDAGLELLHSETFKKDRDLDKWADRSGCRPETKDALRAKLTNAPEGARAFLNPRLAGDSYTFSLEEAILIGRKPRAV